MFNFYEILKYINWNLSICGNLFFNYTAKKKNKVIYLSLVSLLYSNGIHRLGHRSSSTSDMYQQFMIRMVNDI